MPLFNFMARDPSHAGWHFPISVTFDLTLMIVINRIPVNRTTLWRFLPFLYYRRFSARRSDFLFLLYVTFSSLKQLEPKFAVGEACQLSFFRPRIGAVHASLVTVSRQLTKVRCLPTFRYRKRWTSLWKFKRGRDFLLANLMALLGVKPDFSCNNNNKENLYLFTQKI